MVTHIKKRPFQLHQLVIALLLFVIMAVTVFFMVNILAVSLSDSHAVLAGEVNLFPKDLNTAAYKQIIGHSSFWRGYRNTMFYTVFGTIIAVTLTSLCAYPLTKKELYGRKSILGLIVFTMFFEGGLIPTFLVIRSLGLIDTVWAILLPTAINVWNLIIMRTFFLTIPESLEEAAEIDGLNPFSIFLRIIVPLSKPIIATMSLFYSVWFWNDWFRALLFLNDSELYPVTMFLRNIVMGAQLAAEKGIISQAETENVSTTIKSASIILITAPILAVYPFVQKYLVKGMLIGSIKG